MLEISVVIPTFKRPQLLNTCLLHLDNQTIDKSRYEVIVVTDGYDEITLKAVEEYRKSSVLDLKFFNTPEKKGPAAARNLGWKNSNSRLIAFTDDDCQPQSGWLEAYLNQHNLKGPVAYTGFTEVPIEEEPTDFALNTHGLQHADFITANCACTFEALSIVDGFDERYGTAWREDSDLEFNFLQNGIPIVKVTEAVVIHPVREAPWGVSIKEQKKGLYDALIFKKFPHLYRRKLSPKIIYDFYFIVLADIICLIALFTGWFYIAAVTFLVVFIMIFTFFYKRIKNTKKSRDHIWEMWVTSLVLPFLSVYWRIFGALKFKVLFL